MANEINPDSRQGLTCDVCEAMCLDAVDGTLTAAEQAALELHVASCAACAEQFAEAQRGAAWMEMLKAHGPEPSSSLLTSILAKTSGAASEPNVGLHLAPTSPALLPMPLMPLPSIVAAPAIAAGGKLLQFRRRFGSPDSYGSPFGSGQVYLQPRLAMTAAMAFFSLALTMNLTGTKLSDLRPSALHRTVADAGAGAVRSFQNLRVVYQVESKVSELRQDEMRDERDRLSRERPSGERQRNEDEAPAVQPKQERHTDKPAIPDGSSKLEQPGEPAFRLTGTQTGPSISAQAGTEQAAAAQAAPRQKGV